MYPTIRFSYDRSFDIWNIRVDLQMLQYAGRQANAELRMLLETTGPDPDDAAISSYLDKRWSGREELRTMLLAQLEAFWRPREAHFFATLGERMDAVLPQAELHAYLSTTYGCGYDESRGAFAVSVFFGTLANARIVMHETMHLAFHVRWWEHCRRAGVSEERTWAIKEAVTILLNFWFRDDLLEYDQGHPEHGELRRLLLVGAKRGDAFPALIEEAIAYVQAHPEVERVRAHTKKNDSPQAHA